VWSPSHLPCPQDISELIPIEWLGAVKQSLEALQFDSIADVFCFEPNVGGCESVGGQKGTS